MEMKSEGELGDHFVVVRRPLGTVNYERSGLGMVNVLDSQNHGRFRHVVSVPKKGKVASMVVAFPRCGHATVCSSAQVAACFSYGSSVLPEVALALNTADCSVFEEFFRAMQIAAKVRGETVDGRGLAIICVGTRMGRDLVPIIQIGRSDSRCHQCQLSFRRIDEKTLMPCSVALALTYRQQHVRMCAGMSHIQHI